MDWMPPPKPTSPRSPPLLWDWADAAVPGSSSGEVSAAAAHPGRRRKEKRGRAEEGGGGGGEVRCQVEGCGVELVGVKDYHRKHRVCEAHSKFPRVVVAGQERRFCQQCSRWARRSRASSSSSSLSILQKKKKSMEAHSSKLVRAFLLLDYFLQKDSLLFFGSSNYNYNLQFNHTIGCWLICAKLVLFYVGGEFFWCPYGFSISVYGKQRCYLSTIGTVCVCEWWILLHGWVTLQWVFFFPVLVWYLSCAFIFGIGPCCAVSLWLLCFNL